MMIMFETRISAEVIIEGGAEALHPDSPLRYVPIGKFCRTAILARHAITADKSVRLENAPGSILLLWRPQSRRITAD